MASYCDIKSKSGHWILRIDDIDGPRSVPGSAVSIQRTLELYGFEWHGPIHWQSARQERYETALAELVRRELIFNCGCSRKSLPTGEVYPGRCRGNLIAIKHPPTGYHCADHALRCKLTGKLAFTDEVQGHQSIELDNDVGDIIIWRRDNLVSYALACAVDDAENASRVVRGADLLSSTATQVAIMQALDLPVPEYAHIPIAMDANGDKLSKHSKAQTVSTMPTLATLLFAWKVLGQTEIQTSSISNFWEQAIKHWEMTNVPSMVRLSL